MSDIFLSYKSEDRPRAKIISEALEKYGFSVWWDRIIPPGKTWSQVIEEELRNAKCVVVLWSKESVKSDWVSSEASDGSRRRILIPVLIDNVEIPLEFRRLQASNLINWDGTLPNPELDLLVKSIGKILYKSDKLNVSAQQLYNEEKYQDAIDAWKKVLELDQDNINAIDGLKNAKLRLEEKVKKLSIDELNVSAQQLYQEKKYSEAIDKWSKVLNLDQNNKIAKDGIPKAVEAKEIIKAEDLKKREIAQRKRIITYTAIGIFGLLIIYILFSIIGPHTSVEILDAPVTVEEKTSFEITWKVNSINKTNINHTAIHYGPESKSEPLTLGSYPNISMAGSLSMADTVLIPGVFSSNITIEYPGKVYFRAHAIIDDKNYWSEEKSLNVLNESEKGNLRVVISKAPSIVETGNSFEIRWNIESHNEIEIDDTAIYYGPESKSEPLLNNYNSKSSSYEDFLAPKNLSSKIIIETPGIFYFRAYVRDHNGKSYWSEEKKIVVLKIFNNSINMQFVLIPAGEFYMGNYSNEMGRFDNERPLHRVTLENAFYIGKFEVTQKQWLDVMGNNPSFFKSDDLPVDSVSWNDVRAFIIKLNEKENTNKYRLPTEAEWEYAARANTTTRYSFGDDESKLGEYAWYYNNTGDHTREIGKKEPNLWGLYDMHGNVWEWVQDKWHGDYKGAPTNGRAWEGDSDKRVRRGGSWNDNARYCRSASRDGHGADERDKTGGFRLVMDR